MTDRIWITWEDQRRSRELAAYFGCKLYLLSDTGLLRYPVVIAKTLVALARERPKLVFVQNPSMVLAVLAVLWSKVTGRPVVVDRHTTFLLNYRGAETIKIRVFRVLSSFTLRHASLTIVTNEFLAGLVRAAGGRAAVLPDRLPSLVAAETPAVRLDPKRVNILLIASFAEDEPISEVIAAMEALGTYASAQLYISGRPKRSFASLVAKSPPNVIFTGYLPEADFVALLRGVDLVLTLTTMDHTMLCGCYEAIAAERPLITSDFDALRRYFDGATFVDNSAGSISLAIREVMDSLPAQHARTKAIKVRLEEDWRASARSVQDQINCLPQD